MFGDPRNTAWYGKRAVLYIRVSTDEQAKHGYSLDAQREELHEFCSQYNINVIAEYSDEGVSARKAIMRRPGLLKVLDVVRGGGVDYVLFIKLDRWFRSVSEYYEAQKVLDAAGVNWKATLEEYDTSTTNGRLSLNIRLSVAQDESDRTSDRIKFVNANRIKNGGCVYGSQSLPYALEIKDHCVVVNQEQAVSVRAMFDYYEETSSAHGCMSYLREQCGITLPFATIRRMLRNSLYAGRYRDNTTYCEAIVPVEQFDRIQVMLEANAKNHIKESKYTYIFPGLLRCPLCGGTLKAHPAKDYKFNRVYLRYRCNKKWTEQACDFGGEIWEKRIEDWLLDHIQPQLKAYVANFDVEASQKKRAVIDTDKIERKIRRLQDLYVDELIDADGYREKYAALNTQLKAAQDQNVVPEKLRDLSVVRALLAGDFREIYQQLKPEERRQLWRSVIDHITVNNTAYNKYDFDVVFL